MADRSLARFLYSIKKLESIKTNGYSLISLIVPPGGVDKLNQVRALVAADKILITEEKDKFEELHYIGFCSEQILGRLRRKLESIHSIPPNGLIYFLGYWTDDSNQQLSIELDLPAPAPVQHFMFVGNYRFMTEELHTMAHTMDGPMFALVVFDYNGALFAKVQGTKVEICIKVGMQLRRNVNPEAMGKIYSLINEELYKLFIPKAKPIIDGIVLAGVESTLHEKLASHLDPVFKSMLIKVLTIAAEDETDALPYIVPECIDEPKMQGLHLIKELQLLRTLDSHIGIDAVKGPQEVADALAHGKASHVYISDETFFYRVTGAVPGTSDVKTLYWTSGESRSAFESLKSVEMQDLTDWLLVTASPRVTIHIISKGSPAGKRFWRDVGIAAHP